MQQPKLISNNYWQETPSPIVIIFITQYVYITQKTKAMPESISSLLQTEVLRFVMHIITSEKSITSVIALMMGSLLLNPIWRVILPMA